MTDIADLFTAYRNKDLVSYIFAISGTKNLESLLAADNQSIIDLKDMSLYELTDEGITTIQTNQSSWEYRAEINQEYLNVSCTYDVLNEGGRFCSFRFGTEEYIEDNNGIYILTFNSFTKNIVCVKHITFDSDGNIYLQ